MAEKNSGSLYYPLTKMNFLVTVDSVNGIAAFSEVTGVEATVDNVKSETYKVFRYFLVVTKGEPEGNAKTFIDYMLSEEGQKIVTDDHYISVN